jgi:hypothetical protein
MKEANYDYYYGAEADTYSFYRIPKTLFSDPAFADMSCEAKVLYGLMLDRMGLSVKNNWLDAENRVYIYFTVEDAQEYLNCRRDKAMKLLAELDTAKGAGLIERVRQGLGKPSRIYVKKLVAGTDLLKSEKPTSGQHEKPATASRKNRPFEVGKTDANKTEYIKTDISETEQSIYPAGKQQDQENRMENPIDAIDGYRGILAENISCDVLCENYGSERVEGVMELLAETICTRKWTVRIGGEDIPAEVVRGRLLKLNTAHIEYVFECLDACTAKIQNIRAYLLTALYRAPTTMEPYYQALVSHDLYGGDIHHKNCERMPLSPRGKHRMAS